MSFAEQTYGFLERTPRVLSELLAGLPDEWLGETDVEGGWTARDVAGHLLTAELSNWAPRLEWIQTHDTSAPFPPFDRFAHVARDAGAGLRDLLERFAAQRAESLARARAVVPDDSRLDLRGLHPELGEVTARNILATWSAHDLDHTQQVLAALAATRGGAVGPFRRYLGILVRRDAAPG